MATSNDADNNNNNDISASHRSDAAAAVVPAPNSWLSPVVLSILWTETAERFSYFGFRAILVLYFTNSLAYSESTSIALYAYTTSLAYLMPLLGALLADGAWGCYRTIFWFGVTYAVGLMMLTWAASLATTVTNPTSASTTTEVATATTSPSFWQQALSFGGLFLVCIGTGGIKPCVSAFGANQVVRPPPPPPSPPTATLPGGPGSTNKAPSANILTPEQQNQQYVQAFFAYFYFCINVGAVLSIAVIPIIREYFGFAAAFGIPTLFMCFAIFFFWWRRNEYIHQAPSNTLAATLIECCRLMYHKTWCGSRLSCQSFWRSTTLGLWWQRGVGRTPLPHTMGRPALVPTHNKNDIPSVDDPMIVNNDTRDCSHDRHHSGDSTLLTGRRINCYYDGSQKEREEHLNNNSRNDERSQQQLTRDAEQALRVLPIMAMFPFYWMLYDQQGSVWTLQATRMTLHGLQPEQLTLVNPIQIMIFIPLFQQYIYPALARRGWNLTHINRIRMGMILAALSFFASGLLESAIQRTEQRKSAPPSVFWQLIQITILAVSEIFVSVTGLEWAYDTAPQRIKALLMAMFLLTTAVGDFLGGILYSTIFQTWNRATILHVCATLLLVNRALLDLVVHYTGLPEAAVADDDDEDEGASPLDTRGIVGVSDACVGGGSGEVHHRVFKELTTRSSSLMGMELPPVHDVVD